MTCAVCKESNLRHRPNFDVLRGPSAKNDTKSNIWDSSDENMERDLLDLRGALFGYWNDRRSRRSIPNLKRSVLADQQAQSMADRIAETGVVVIDPSYGDACHGSSAVLVARHRSIRSIFRSWYNSDGGENTMKDNIRFTGIGITKKSSSEIYAVQIFCSFNFVNNIKLVNEGDQIRSRIFGRIRNERLADLDPINDSASFQMLAQGWAETAARRGKISTHDGDGNGSYRRVCFGAGGEVGAFGTTSDIESTVDSLISEYITDSRIRYTGVGISIRNDGAVFFVQLFCSLEFKDQRGTPGYDAPREVSFVVNKENERRATVSGHSLETASLKISSVTTEYAKEWANKLKESDTISEDPELSRGCVGAGAHSFQIVATGSNESEIWSDIFRQKRKLGLLGNFKFKFVGSGIAEMSNDDFVLVQNFCTWKPQS